MTDQVTEDQKSLATTRLAKIGETKTISLVDVWDVLVSGDHSKSRTPAVPPAPSSLSDAQKDALKRLPEVYGKVVPKTVRRLTAVEARAIVEERDVIDTIMGVLKTRKDVSIRETIANHLDMLLEGEYTPDQLEEIPLDAKGHYQEKQEASIDGSGRKFQKTISDPKPTLGIAAVEKAHKDGIIDRKTYLKITRKPDLPRVLDEDGLIRAMKADPALLFTLAPLTEKAPSTTTIKVAND